MSEEMKEYELSQKADECLDQAVEMFNEPDAGIIKKSFAIGFGFISGWSKTNFVLRAQKRLDEKTKNIKL